MQQADLSEAPIITRGRAYGDGVASGTARFIASPAELGDLRRGEILMAQDITPDWRDGLAAVAAIVINQPDASGHVAALARRFGLLAVVDTVTGAAPMWSGARLTVTCVDGVGVVQEQLPSGQSPEPPAQRPAR